MHGQQMIFKNKINIDYIKILAIIIMTCDHTSKIIFEKTIITHYTNIFPIFAFLVGFNLSKKQDNSFYKYYLRLFIFGIITLIIHTYFEKDRFLNIMWTLMLGIFAIDILRRIDKQNLNKILHYYVKTIFLIFIIMLSLKIEYRIFGPLLIISFYYYYKTNNKIYLLISIILSGGLYLTSLKTYILYMLTTFVITQIPYDWKGSRIIKPWWLFYAYYPLHYLTLYIIRDFLLTK